MIFSRVYQSSEAVRPRNLHGVHLMIDEEMGELARAINRPGRCTETPFEELCDVMICLMDMMWLTDNYSAVKFYNDDRFLTEVGKTFKNDNFIRDQYFAYQELKKEVIKIDLNEASSRIFQRSVDAMIQCCHIMRTYEPALTGEDLRTLARVVINRKCNKWEGLTA